MAKYIRIEGLDGDYPYVFYEPTSANAISDLMWEVHQHTKDGGDMSGIKVEVVQMTPKEFRKIEEI